ncbi:hypothetical protein VPH35_011948 [Triticum aestivum]
MATPVRSGMDPPFLLLLDFFILLESHCVCPSFFVDHMVKEDTMDKPDAMATSHVAQEEARHGDNRSGKRWLSPELVLLASPSWGRTLPSTLQRMASPSLCTSYIAPS